MLDCSQSLSLNKRPIVNSFQVLGKAVRCGWEKLVLLLSVLTKQEIPQLIHSAWFHPGACEEITDKSFTLDGDAITQVSLGT